MHRFRLVVFGACCGLAAFAQKSPEGGVVRTFHLANVTAVRDLQEVATTLRTVGDIGKLAVDEPASSVTVTGSAADVALAGWLLDQMDQPVTPPDAARQIRESAVHEYRVPGSKDDVARTYYLRQIQTPQATQELLTVLRTVGLVRKVFPYTPLHAITMRGPSEQVAWATWVIQEVDHAAGAQAAGTHEFRSGDRWMPVTRVYYPVRNSSPQGLHATLVALRSRLAIRYVFNITSIGALVVGGTSAEIEQATRLIEDLDQVAGR